MSLNPQQWALKISISWLPDFVVEVGQFREKDSDFLAWKALADSSPEDPTLSSLLFELQSIEEALARCTVRAMLHKNQWDDYESKALEQLQRFEMVKGVLQRSKKDVASGSVDAEYNVSQQELPEVDTPPHSKLHGKIRQVDRGSIVTQLQQLQDAVAATNAVVKPQEGDRALNDKFIAQAFEFPPTPERRVPRWIPNRVKTVWYDPKLPWMGVDNDGWFEVEPFGWDGWAVQARTVLALWNKFYHLPRESATFGKLTKIRQQSRKKFNKIYSKPSAPELVRENIELDQRKERKKAISSANQLIRDDERRSKDKSIEEDERDYYKARLAKRTAKRDKLIRAHHDLDLDNPTRNQDIDVKHDQEDAVTGPKRKNREVDSDDDKEVDDPDAAYLHADNLGEDWISYTYKDKHGRYHNSDDMPARIHQDDKGVNRLEEYQIHGRYDRSDPSEPTSIVRNEDGAIRTRVYDNPGMPYLRYSNEIGRDRYSYNRRNESYHHPDEVDVKSVMKKRNQIAREWNSKRAGLMKNDLEDAITRDPAELVRQYTDVIPFPDAETGPKRKQQSSDEDEPIDSVEDDYGMVRSETHKRANMPKVSMISHPHTGKHYKVGDSKLWLDEDDPDVDGVLKDYNDDTAKRNSKRKPVIKQALAEEADIRGGPENVIAEYATPKLPFPSAGTRFVDDIDDEVDLTLDAVNKLTVARIHGAFQRIVYSLQKRKFPKQDATESSSDSSSSSSSSSSDSE